MKLAEDLDQICCFLCVGKGQVVTVLLRISLVLNKDDIQSCQTQCWSMCSYIHFPQLQSASQNSHYLQSIVTHCPCYPFYMARSHNQTKPKTTRALLKRCISENVKTTSLQTKFKSSFQEKQHWHRLHTSKWNWFCIVYCQYSWGRDRFQPFFSRLPFWLVRFPIQHRWVHLKISVRRHSYVYWQVSICRL